MRGSTKLPKSSSVISIPSDVKILSYVAAKIAFMEIRRVIHHCEAAYLTNNPTDINCDCIIVVPANDDEQVKTDIHVASGMVWIVSHLNNMFDVQRNWVAKAIFVSHDSELDLNPRFDKRNASSSSGRCIGSTRY